MRSATPACLKGGLTTHPDDRRAIGAPPPAPASCPRTPPSTARKNWRCTSPRPWRRSSAPRLEPMERPFPPHGRVLVFAGFVGRNGNVGDDVRPTGVRTGPQPAHWE